MNLKHLCDKELLKEASYWAKQEREALCELLWRLKEIDERKLYSELRCKSLFDYCITVLKYSEGEASRRVSACRILRKLPEISNYIQRGEIKLTQVNLATFFFKKEKITSIKEMKIIFEKLKNKTTRETERLLWELKKMDSPRKVSVLLKEETLEELKKLQDLKAHSCPDLDSLLLKMCAVVGKIWDPTLVHRRRANAKEDKRYISVQLKAEVWSRDQGKCKICKSTTALQLDHIVPFAAGGKTTLENMRLLCRNCNQRKGLEYFRSVRANPDFTRN